MEYDELLKWQKDFIGREFKTHKGGTLKVTGVAGKKGAVTVFTLKCSICSEDLELFPEGSLVSTKGNLTDNKTPCGCSKAPKWSKWQFEVLIKRACTKKGYLFLGFVGEFKGRGTYIRLHNPANNTWESTNISSFLHHKTGCPLEAKNKRWTSEERKQQIQEVFNVEGGVFLGWESDIYKNAHSKFIWLCPEGHKCTTEINSFLKTHRRCKDCAKMRLKEDGIGYGYYPSRKEEQDYLYITHFKKGDYIKIGRSFDIERRLNQLLSLSDHKRKEVEFLAVYTGRHENVYNIEQQIHKELTSHGFYHEKSEWTTETFYIGCESVLFELLNKSSLIKI